MKNILKELRKNCGLNQTELAAAVGVSKNTISSIEFGDFYPTLKLALKLAKFFECNVEDIFYID